MKVNHAYGDLWIVQCEDCGQPQPLLIKGLQPDSAVWCKYCPNKLFFREIERFPAKEANGKINQTGEGPARVVGQENSQVAEGI